MLFIQISNSTKCTACRSADHPVHTLGRLENILLATLPSRPPLGRECPSSRDAAASCLSSSCLMRCFCRSSQRKVSYCVLPWPMSHTLGGERERERRGRSRGEQRLVVRLDLAYEPYLGSGGRGGGRGGGRPGGSERQGGGGGRPLRVSHSVQAALSAGCGLRWPMSHLSRLSGPQ